jgi:hypothetical protein
MRRKFKHHQNLQVMRPAIDGNYAIAVPPWITFLALTMRRLSRSFEVLNIMNIVRGIALRSLLPALFHSQKDINAQLSGQRAGTR